MNFMIFSDLTVIISDILNNTAISGSIGFIIPVLPLHLFRVIDECFDIIETAYPSVGTAFDAGI